MAWVFIAALLVITLIGFISEIVARRRRKAFLADLDKKKADIRAEHAAALADLEKARAAAQPAPPPPEPVLIPPAQPPAEIKSEFLPPKVQPLRYVMPVLPAGLNYTIQPMQPPERETVMFRAWSNNQQHYVEVINDAAALHGDFRQRHDAWFPALVFRLHKHTDEGDIFLDETYIDADTNPDGKRITNEIRALLDKVRPAPDKPA